MRVPFKQGMLSLASSSVCWVLFVVYWLSVWRGWGPMFLSGERKRKFACTSMNMQPPQPLKSNKLNFGNSSSNIAFKPGAHHTFLQLMKHSFYCGRQILNIHKGQAKINLLYSFSWKDLKGFTTFFIIYYRKQKSDSFVQLFGQKLFDKVTAILQCCHIC